MWFWEAAVLVLRCDSCGKKMCSFDSGKIKTQGKNIFWEKIFWRSWYRGPKLHFRNKFFLGWRLPLKHTFLIPHLINKGFPLLFIPMIYPWEDVKINENGFKKGQQWDFRFPYFFNWNAIFKNKHCTYLFIMASFV